MQALGSGSIARQVGKTGDLQTKPLELGLEGRLPCIIIASPCKGQLMPPSGQAVPTRGPLHATCLEARSGKVQLS